MVDVYPVPTGPRSLLLPPVSPHPPPSPSSFGPVPSSPVVSSPRSESKVGLIAGVCSGAAGLLIVLLVLLWLFMKRKRSLKSTGRLATDMRSRPYSFRELSSLTKNFSDSEILSSGAFGDVFKGTSGSTLVAVKRIRHNQEHGHASFLAEANTLGQIRHRNLLQLRGWCEAKQGPFLVYDFMSNGSLDKWLHNNQVVLPWEARRSIVAGVASGLEYLHEGWVQCVLHRDVKSSNVLLDADFNAYLGDFGLARLIDHRKLQKTTMLAGTLGYMAPEMHYTGRATRESDVYAFGVLVLEVVCGCRPIMEFQPDDAVGEFLLLERVWRAHEAGNIANVADSKLEVDTHPDCEKTLAVITNILQLGLLCCLPSPSERPTMRSVNHWLHSSDLGAILFPALTAAKPGSVALSIPKSLSSEGTSSSQSSEYTR